MAENGQAAKSLDEGPQDGFTQSEVELIDMCIDIAGSVTNAMAPRMAFDDHTTKTWSMALAPVVEDLIAIGEGNHPDPPTQQAGTMHFLNEYAGQVDRDHAELMPTETRIEYLKIRQATLETDQIKLRSMVKAKERKEKGDPEVAAKLPPMTSEVLEKMRNEVLRGLELVIMVRSSIIGITRKIRTIAATNYTDPEDALELKRERCIIMLVSNPELVIALCDCGKLDPRHDVRDRIRKDMDFILHNADHVKKIDKFINSYPGLFAESDDLNLEPVGSAPTVSTMFSGVSIGSITTDGVVPTSPPNSSDRRLKDPTTLCARALYDMIAAEPVRAKELESRLNASLTPAQQHFTPDEIRSAFEECQGLGILNYNKLDDIVFAVQQAPLHAPSQTQPDTRRHTPSQEEDDLPTALAMSELGLSKTWHAKLIEHVAGLFKSQDSGNQDPAEYYRALSLFHNCQSSIKSRQRWLQALEEYKKDVARNQDQYKESAEIMIEIINHCFVQAARGSGNSLEQDPNQVTLKVFDTQQKELYPMRLEDFECMTIVVTGEDIKQLTFDRAWYSGLIINNVALLKGCATNVYPLMGDEIQQWCQSGTQLQVEYDVDKFRYAKLLVEQCCGGQWPKVATDVRLPQQDWWNENADRDNTRYYDDSKVNSYWKSTQEVLEDLNYIPSPSSDIDTVVVAFTGAGHWITGKIKPDFTTRECHVYAYNSEAGMRNGVRSINEWGQKMLIGLARLINIKAGWNQTKFESHEQDNTTRQPDDNPWACGVVTTMNAMKLVQNQEPIREDNVQWEKRDHQNLMLRERTKQFKALWGAVEKASLDEGKLQLPTSLPATDLEDVLDGIKHSGTMTAKEWQDLDEGHAEDDDELASGGEDEEHVEDMDI